MYCIFKIKDIKANPQKYEEVDLERKAFELERQKNYCHFFKSLSHQYGMVNFLFTLILSVITATLLFQVNKLFINGKNLFISTQLIGIMAALFINTIVGLVIIPLHIKKPFFAVSLQDMFNVIGRKHIWKRGYIAFLILFIICFPFYTLSCTNYAYYDEDGIHSSKYFQIIENYTKYEEVSHANIYIHHNDSEQVNSFYYEITLNNGKKININDSLRYHRVYYQSTYEIHRYLEKTSCDFKIVPLNDVDIKYINDKLSENQKNIIYYIYEGRHND